MTGGPWNRLLPIIATLTAMAVAGGTAAGAAPRPWMATVASVARAVGTSPDALPVDGRTGPPLVLVGPVAGRDAWRPSTATPRPQPPAPPIAAYAPQLAASGIPVVALTAYRKAEQRMARAVPGCHLRWYILAGIGRVESNHGRFGGAQVLADGTSQPKILGPALDGRAGFALIRDTDNGVYDGDTTYDRAVGPMQFIPSTWAMYASDGDGDGRTDPFNLFDAALAAADYLCNGHDLATSDGVRAAVRNYNHSDEYVELVLAIAAEYARGVKVETAPPAPGSGHLPTPPAGAQPPAAVGPPKAAVPTSPSPSQSPSQSPSPTSSPTPTPSPTGPAPPTSPVPPTESPTPTPTPTPTCTPSPSPTPTPTAAAAPAPTQTTAGTPTSGGTTSADTTSGTSTPATTTDTTSGTPTVATATDTTPTPTPTPTPTC